MQHDSEHKDRLMKERDIRILLVDDHDLVLQGLKRIVECSLPEIKNVCTASSGQEALHLIASQRFNLFVLDMELPDISGMDIIVRIREKDPRARIIVNTMHEEIWFIKDLIQSAVDGILFKSIDSTKISRSHSPGVGWWNLLLPLCRACACTDAALRKKGGVRN